MTALAITPVAVLAGFAVVVVAIAAVAAALSLRSRRRADKHADHGDGPLIDLAYLERAIRADADATARRAEESRPLLSRSPGPPPDPSHRLPRNGRGDP